MKQSLGSNALKLTSSKIITMTISLLTAMLLSRFRTLKEYGTYSQLLLVINLFTTIFMLGLPNSINFFLARAENPEEKQKFLSVYYTLTTVLSFITGLILVLSTPIIVNYFHNALIKNFMYVLAVYPWAKIVLSSIDNIYIVYKKVNRLMIFRILNSIYLLIIILFVQILNWGFNAYLGLFVAGEALFAFAVYIIARNFVGKIQVSFNMPLMKTIFKFSIPIGLATMLGTLNIELDKLMIGNFFNTEQLAIYTNASKEMPVNIVAISLTAVLMPQLVQMLKRNKKKEAISLWSDSISLSYAMLCFFALGLFVFAPDVISLLYSDKYLPGVAIFRIYNIALLLRFTYFGIILNSIGKTKLIFYSSIASLGLNFVLNYLFYRIFGFIGPAIATIIAISAVAIFQIVATAKNIHIPLKKILPWKILLNITLVNVLMSVSVYFIKIAVPLNNLIGEIMESVILGTLWGAVYFFLMRKLIKQKWELLNGETYLE